MSLGYVALDCTKVKANASNLQGWSWHPGNRQQDRCAWVGCDRDHVANGDATGLACVEVLADAQHATAIGFLSRAVAWFNGLGGECRQVMSDNGSVYVSRSFSKACKDLGLKFISTRPYTPSTNGKADRFI